MSINNDGKHEAPSTSNGTYDMLKFVEQVLLPGLGTLYYTVAEIWGLPFATEVVGTIVAVTLFFGLVVRWMSGKYHNSDAKYDGSLTVDTENEVMKVEFDDRQQLENVRTAREVTFKVRHPG